MGRGDGVLAALPPPSGGSAPVFPGPHGRAGGSRVSLRLWVGGVQRSPRMGFSDGPGWGWALVMCLGWGAPSYFIQ